MNDRLNGDARIRAGGGSEELFRRRGQARISKSLASRHVSALERSLSVKLLNRSTRKLSLTEAGALFYEHCARIVQEAELAEQHMTRVQVRTGGSGEA